MYVLSQKKPNLHHQMAYLRQKMAKIPIQIPIPSTNATAKITTIYNCATFEKI